VAYLCLPLTAMIYAGRLLNKDTNMSAWYEENQELMLMTCPSPPKAKQRWKLYFGWLPMFAGRPVGIVGDWCWCKGHVCKFESHCLNIFFNACVVFAQINLLIKTVHFYLYIFQSFRVELVPRATGNGYRSMQIVMFEKECNCRLSVKHTQSSNYLLMNKQ
jgi:hypothetical protein